MIYDEKYIPFLLHYCQKNKIKILLSFFDMDLLILSQNKQKFIDIGVKVIVSKEEIIKICNDKWLTYLFLKDNGFSVPQTYLSIDEVISSINRGEINYPIFIKPRFGCGSIGIFVADNADELSLLSNICLQKIENSYLRFESSEFDEKVLFQETLEGEEYGADVINNLNEELEQINIRHKIAMRAGETDIAETVYDDNIHDTLSKLGLTTKHVANLDVDIILSNKIPYIIDLNARFGGGYPFAHIAGCDLPKAIIKWAKGKKVNKNILKARLGVKGFKELFVQGK